MITLLKKYVCLIIMSPFILVQYGLSLLSLQSIKSIYKARIYDCFIFFNELELLEIRLNILFPYVDYFVIVEASTTFSGKKEPLYFKENLRRFKKFQNKIIYIEVNDLPPLDKEALRGRFVLEAYQRDQIARGLTNCENHDIIFVSDVDEIPNPRYLGTSVVLLNTFLKCLACRQKFYYYYLNGYLGSCSTRAKCCNYRNFAQFFDSSADKLRWHNCRAVMWEVLWSGGWHFSYLGGVDAIINKISSFSHAEYDSDQWKDRDAVKTKINGGKDLFDRNYSIRYIRIGAGYPQYLLRNLNKFSHLIKNLN